jgi:hypothetical protein
VIDVGVAQNQGVDRGGLKAELPVAPVGLMGLEVVFY